jgi:hypothetical protein
LGQNSAVLAAGNGEMTAALDSFGIKEGGFDDLSNLIGSEKFSSWATKRSGRHWPQSGYAPRSSRITYSTIIGLALEYRRMADLQ